MSNNQLRIDRGKGAWNQDLEFCSAANRGQGGCYIIAEIGGNFNGDMDLAIQSIDSAVNCGADAVKFQTFRAEDIVADPNLTHTYLDPSGKEITVSQLEMFKQMELPFDWHEPLQLHARAKGVDFLSSAADVESARLLMNLKVPVMKIASEDLINLPVVETIAASGFPTMISTGMADEEEIARALKIFSEAGNFNVMLLHCTSQYPTPIQACNVRRIAALRTHFGVPVGFSDHSHGWLTASLAVALGARVLEKHFTLDHCLPGPDHAMSTTPEEFKLLVQKLRETEILLGRDTVTYAPEEERARVEFRRSIVARRRIKKGEQICEEMLAYRRPGGGLRPYERDQILGKKLIIDVGVNEKIHPSMVKP